MSTGRAVRRGLEMREWARRESVGRRAGGVVIRVWRVAQGVCWRMAGAGDIRGALPGVDTFWGMWPSGEEGDG